MSLLTWDFLFLALHVLNLKLRRIDLFLTQQV